MVVLCEAVFAQIYYPTDIAQVKVPYLLLEAPQLDLEPMSPVPYVFPAHSMDYGASSALKAASRTMVFLQFLPECQQRLEVSASCLLTWVAC